MVEYWLVVVLAANTSGLVPATRHLSAEACAQQRAVEVVHLAVTGRAVASADCVRVAARRVPPVTGEALR
jgi:hypothetical protein